AQIRLQGSRDIRAVPLRQWDLPETRCHGSPAATHRTRPALAPEQRIGIDRWLDAARAAIQQSDAEGRLELGDSLRHGWLRHAESARRLRHAAALRDGLEDMEVM